MKNKSQDSRKGAVSFSTWSKCKEYVENVKKEHVSWEEEKAILFAQIFCKYILRYIWSKESVEFGCRRCKNVAIKLSAEERVLAESVARYLLSLKPIEYGYLLGNLYTMLLPDTYRASYGVFYTPPTIAERLVDMLTEKGVDWLTANVLDPASGGGAFLITVANRFLEKTRESETTAEERLVHLETHLFGYEIDEFAAWMTQVLLDIMILPETKEVGRKMERVVQIADTIKQALKTDSKYDVIIGNPPYGKVQLDEQTRMQYARSLFGHANLYGIFMDAALRMRKKDGVIGFVVPTSFLGGKYFCNLRSLMAEEAPPMTIDFIDMRNGVFDEVLQETCLVTLGNNQGRMVNANKLLVEHSACRVQNIGNFVIQKGSEPWIIARERSEAEILNVIKKKPVNLVDYGYKVSTGQLVWNRMKKQIYEQPALNRKPIIWAEAISAKGKFLFHYQSRKSMSYFELSDKQDFLICREQVVLVQRTTAKEQNRRLLACSLPKEFVDQWDGVVIENHVNLIRPLGNKGQISTEALSAILNSDTVDKIFRCLSGSVAVSATELHALLLPDLEAAKEIDCMIRSGDEVSREAIEKVVKKGYGLEDKNEK